MKRSIHLFFYTITAALFLATGAMAQTGLVPDQNPDYMMARDKYMKVSDSLINFHSITVQETYKAVDFLADRREARDQRRAFRQQLRMERVRYGGYYYNDYSSPYYYNNFPYYDGYRSYRYGRGWNRNYNFYRNALPLAVTLGTLGWWCR
jgi:hypothetical protein